MTDGLDGPAAPSLGATLEAPPKVRAVSTGTSDDEGAVSFLRQRVRYFGFGGGALSSAFLVYRFGADLLQPHDEEKVSMAYHALNVVLYVGMALVAGRFGTTSRRLRLIEGVGFIGGNAALCAMVSEIPLFASPSTIGLLAMGLSMFLRAAFVPSTGACTLTMGAAIAVPIGALAYSTALAFDPAVWSRVDPHLVEMTTAAFALRRTADALVWWLLFTAASVATSRVIYGLRREMRAVRKLGRYHLEERLGAGGMGVVYRATHAMLERPTAVKVLASDRLTDGGRSRFEREVQLTAKLRHPNTITVYDYGRTADGLFYYAMEYIEGANLAELVALDGPQTEGRAIKILRETASALVEAHGHGLIHRDLKPANIMVHLPHDMGGVNETTKVLDFGLVKNLRDDNVTRTRPGLIRGTPQYLAPEAIKDPESVGPPADVYAIGAVGYFLLTGRPVFEGDTVIEVCAQHLRDVPVPPSTRAGRPIHAGLERLILQCLEKSPAARPASALELERMLAALDAPGWSDVEATAWWRAHKPALDESRKAERARISEDLDPLLSPGTA
jgi:serine/threonine-protein kinase